MTEKTLNCYVLRVQKNDYRRELTVQNLKTGQTRVFDRWEDLLSHLNGLEPDQAEQSRSPPQGLEPSK